MTGITTYLSILTLNINGLNSPIKKTPIGKLLPTGDTPHQQTQALAGSERLEEDLSSQRPPKTDRDSNTYLRQSKLQTYIDQMK
jgi:hypothetical protein